MLSPRSLALTSGLFAAALATLSACGQDGISRTLPNGDGGSGGASASSSSSGDPSGGSSSGGGGGPDGKPLKLLNWNTHNFFNLTIDDSDADQLSQSEYTSKRKDVAGVLAALKPDIAVLQELEDENVLKDLNATIAVTAGAPYPHTAMVPTKDIREIAVLSNVPLDKVVSHQDEIFEMWGTMGPSYKYTRDALEVHLTFGGREIVLLGVHFRSKFAPDDPDKRLSEAQHTCDIAKAIAAASPNAAIVILGDYNDLPDSAPLKALTTCDMGYSDAAMLLPKADQWSFTYQGTKELIDHQLSNPTLSALLDPASVTIMHSATVDAASDHSPLMGVYYFK